MFWFDHLITVVLHTLGYNRPCFGCGRLNSAHTKIGSEIIGGPINPSESVSNWIYVMAEDHLLKWHEQEIIIIHWADYMFEIVNPFKAYGQICVIEPVFAGLVACPVTKHNAVQYLFTARIKTTNCESKYRNFILKIPSAKSLPFCPGLLPPDMTVHLK